MIEIIKNKIINCIGQNINIYVQGSRNKQFEYNGIIKDAYDNLFIIEDIKTGNIKSVNYVDILTGNIIYEIVNNEENKIINVDKI